jgi:hypothetical protein
LSKSKTPSRLRKTEPVTFETVRKLALALPGVEEGKSWGTPAFRVGKKFLARLREDGDLVVRVEFAAREVLMGAAPETFYITDHYGDYPAMLVRLSKVDPDDLRELLEEAWRRNASKKLLAEFEENRDR